MPISLLRWLIYCLVLHISFWHIKIFIPTNKFVMTMRYYTALLVFSLLFLSNSMMGRADELNNIPDSIIQFIKTADQIVVDDFPRAITLIDKAINWANQENNKPTLFKMHRKKGYYYEQNNNLEQATVSYVAALGLQSYVSDTAKIDIFLDWAILNKKRGDYKTAKEYYQNTLKIAEEKNDFEMIGYAYNGLATLHGALSDFEKAIEYNLKALNAAEKTKDKNSISASYRNIAIVYLKAQNYDLALKNAETSCKIAYDSKNPTAIAHSLETHGKIFNTIGNPQSAIMKFQEALNVMEKMDDKQFIAELLMQLGESYMQLNELDKSEYYYKKSFEYESFLASYELPNLYFKWGNLCVKTNRNAAALKAFNTSLAFAERKQLKDLIQKNNAALALLYKQTGDLPNAYACLAKASAYSDSLFSEANTRHITEAQFKYNMAEGEKQIQALQLRQGRFGFGTAVIIFLLITVALTYFLRAKAINNKALLQKTAEIQLQNRRLQDSNEILHQFAYASAHDLKEPLRSIGSFTSIIAKRYLPLLPPEASEYMNFVTGGVKRMESLLSGLLEYSTIIAEDHTATKAFNVKSVLDDVIKNLHSKIVEKGATIECQNPAIYLLVNRLHLIQLFQNLIGNALKFTSETPKITVSCVVQKEIILISIKDNGIGIKQEHGDKIFKLFQRLSRAPQYEGTGIGLTICKNIVEKHNGKIWFESEEGQGTTFFISLPVHLVQQNNQITEGTMVSKKEVLQLA